MSELQRLVHKLEQGQKIVCECCQLDHAGLLPVHKEDCKIVKHYEKEGKYLGITGIGFGHILCVKDMEK